MTPTVFQGVLGVCSILAILALSDSLYVSSDAEPIALCGLVFFSVLLGYLIGVSP